MKISKSKRQLAQLLIEAGVKQFPDGAEWAAQDKCHERFSRNCGFYRARPVKPSAGCSSWSTAEDDPSGIVGEWIEAGTLIPNWHQTVISRSEFDQIVAETHTVDQAPADPVPDEVREEAEEPETIEQLAAKYRDSVKLAWIIRDSLRQADNAVDAALAALVAAGKAQGLNISVDDVVSEEKKAEPELVITDWRDLRIGDVIEYVDGISANIGLIGAVTQIDGEPDTNKHVKVKFNDVRRCGWPTKWRFIRRP